MARWRRSWGGFDGFDVLGALVLVGVIAIAALLVGAVAASVWVCATDDAACARLQEQVREGRENAPDVPVYHDPFSDPFFPPPPPPPDPFHGNPFVP